MLHTASRSSDFNLCTVDIHLCLVVIRLDVEVLNAQEIFPWRCGLGDCDIQLRRGVSHRASLLIVLDQ